MKKAEALLPDTRALPTATVEFSHYHGRILVRFRHHDGTTDRQTFTDPEAAHRYEQECCDKLRQEARRHGALPNG